MVEGEHGQDPHAFADSPRVLAVSTVSAFDPLKTHRQPRAGRFGVAAQRGEGRRHPAALQPRDRRLGRAEPPSKLRLRQLRRRAGTDQRLYECVLLIDARVFLAELGGPP